MTTDTYDICVHKDDKLIAFETLNGLEGFVKDVYVDSWIGKTPCTHILGVGLTAHDITFLQLNVRVLKFTNVSKWRREYDSEG